MPHLKSIVELSYARVMLIQFAFFSAYFLFSVPWSKVVNTIGYQKTMIGGLLTMTVGASLFIPAASAATYPLFLTALVVLAGGITGLQVAANPYVALSGKPETASSRLDLTQAFNSLGTTIAPKLGGFLILSSAPLAVEELGKLSPAALHLYRVQQASSVKMPYIVIGLALLVLAGLIAGSKLPTIETATRRSSTAVGDSIWKHPNLYLGAIGVFTYVGAEVSIGSFLVNYFGSPDIAGLSAKTAAGLVSFAFSRVGHSFRRLPILDCYTFTGRCPANTTLDLCPNSYRSHELASHAGTLQRKVIGVVFLPVSRIAFQPTSCGAAT